MAIQGIIFGYVHPEERERNLILLGRGAHYELVVDGVREEILEEGLDAAIKSCKRRAVVHCANDWVNVIATSTDAIGHTQVKEQGGRTFEESSLVADTEDDGGPDETLASRDRG